MRETVSTETSEGTSEKRFIEKYLNVIWFIAFLIGVILWIVGYNLNEGEKPSATGHVLEMIGEFLSLVVSLHVFYEIFTKNAERKILKEELNNIVAPQKELLDLLKKNVNDLDEHTKTVFNLVRYQDTEFFEVKWKYIAQKYDELCIIGDFHFSFLEGIKDKLQKPDKSLSIYLSAYLKNREDIVKILKLSQECTATINIYHLDRFDWGFIAFGTSKNETNADILLNYFSISETKMSGYHIEGETAVNLLKTLRPNIENKPNNSRQNEKAWPLRIDNEDVLDSISEIGDRYVRSINNLHKGTVLLGEEAICKKMAELLEATQKTLRVTHIAIDENIQLLESPDFEAWLQKNYDAAGRKVDIERILLIPKGEVRNETIQRVVKKLRENKIRVRYVVMDDDKLDNDDIRDFSIYDDKHLVYINVETTEWKRGSKNSRAEARYSTDKGWISNYRKTFHSLASKAKEFPF